MKLLTILLLLIVSGLNAQTYNPNTATPLNKPLGISQAVSTDARSMFYDATHFRWRAYNGTAEVLSFLSTPTSRMGWFPIIVNNTGTLNNTTGVFSDSTIIRYWFKNGTKNSDLVPDTSNASGGTGGSPVKDTTITFTVDVDSILIPTGLNYDPSSFTVTVQEVTTSGDVGAETFNTTYDFINRRYVLRFTGIKPLVGTTYRYSVTMIGIAAG